LSDKVCGLILPILYKETVPDEKYVRTVDLGCFKHKVDDGLPLRKAAYQALATILEVAPHRLDLKEYIRHIREGLSDTNDIQILSYQILQTVAVEQGQEMLTVVDELPEYIMKGIRAKLKEAKGEEPERAKDVLRTAVKALSSINKIPNIQQCIEFSNFYLRVLKTPILAKMLSEINNPNETPV